jgi:hypothetical protein
MFKNGYDIPMDEPSGLWRFFGQFMLTGPGKPGSTTRAIHLQ